MSNTEAARLREALHCFMAAADHVGPSPELEEAYAKARTALQPQPSEANAELVEALEDACGIALADFAVKIYFDTESGASKAHALLRKIWRVANRTGLHPSSDNQEKG